MSGMNEMPPGWTAETTEKAQSSGILYAGWYPACVEEAGYKQAGTGALGVELKLRIHHSFPQQPKLSRVMTFALWYMKASGETNPAGSRPFYELGDALDAIEAFQVDGKTVHAPILQKLMARAEDGKRRYCQVRIGIEEGGLRDDGKRFFDKNVLNGAAPWEPGTAVKRLRS